MKSASRVNWPAVAEKLAAEFPRDRWEPAARAWTEDAPSHQTWAVAFSGGADSLALLLLVWTNFPARRRRLVALHFNHRLRGRASNADEAFCRAVCRALKVKFKSAPWTSAPSDPSEAEARTARRAFFDRALGRASAALWTGHQQDDVAETMLMRLARGSGTGGLAAPRPVQTQSEGRVHVRPLLSIKKREIEGALKRAGASWREDETNHGVTFFRNRVRASVIPAWQKSAAERDVLAGAARSRRLLDEDDAALEAWLDELNPQRGQRGLNLAVLHGKPIALWRRALHRWLLHVPEGAALSRQAFDRLLTDARSGRKTRHSVGRRGFVVIEKTVLRFEGNSRKKSGEFHQTTN